MHEMLKYNPYDKPPFREYDPQWIRDFEVLQNIVKMSTRHPLEHVGSTAVFGLPGKGVVDALLIVPENDFIESAVDDLKLAGFQDSPYFNRTDPFRKPLLVAGIKYDSREFLTHLHVAAENSIHHRRLVNLRDFLRTNEPARKEYERLKRSAQGNITGGRREYAEGKAPLLDKVDEGLKNKDLGPVKHEFMVDYLGGACGLRVEATNYLGKGANNHAYKVSLEGGEHNVLRVPRSDVVDVSGDLRNEAETLRFLSAQGCDFCPSSLFFDEDLKAHLTSWVGGYIVPVEKFTEEQVEQFSINLASIHSLPTDSSNPLPVEKLGDRVKKFPQIIERVTGNLHLYPEEFAWAIGTQPHIESVALNFEEQSPKLTHGDLGKNQKWNDNKMYFIDWEDSMVRCFNELGILWARSGFNSIVLGRLLEIYAHHAGVNAHCLHNEVKTVGQVVAYESVLWAINKASTASDRSVESSGYTRLAKNRIKNYQTVFDEK